MPGLVAHLLTACVASGVAAAVYAQPRLEPVATVDVPAHTVEIIRYHGPERLLLATNGLWESVDVFDVESLDPPRLTMLDLDPETPGAQGFGTGCEPTSVALHPTEPVALVSVLGRSVEQPGRLVAFDLRRGGGAGGGRGHLGRVVLDQAVGYHPDAVGVSPDGRWALLACEGEGSPDTPGEVWAVDLAGLTADRRPGRGELPAFRLHGLSRLMGTPAGELEPEVVVFDPLSRFAVVTLQENDAFVAVDLTGGPLPRLAGVTTLPAGAEPDGVAVIDGVAGPDGREGALIAVCEEGKFSREGRITGNQFSLHWVDPADLTRPAVLMSRTDVRPWVDPDKPDRRRDPESVLLTRVNDRVLAVVTIERGDRLLLLDVTDPAGPELLDVAKVGDRPEGIVLVPDPAEGSDDLLIVTGDEGSWGPGTVSVIRLIIE